MRSPGGPPYRAVDGVHLVELRLNTVQQLFSTLDPSPFHERDLDADAEEYLVASVEELPEDASAKLIVHLPAAEAAREEARQLEASIRAYFAYRLWAARRRLRHLMRDGRVSLAVGLAFLAVCFGLRELALGFAEGPFAAALAEGLVIPGWVAMWRPIEIFLYAWRPIRKDCRMYERLARIAVEVQPR